MVTKNIINNIFTKILNYYNLNQKCSRFKTEEKITFSNIIKNRISTFYDDTKNLTNEKVVLLTKNGKIVFSKIDKENSWKITSEELKDKNIHNETDLYLIHNHITPATDIINPSGEHTCLDITDMNRLKDNFSLHFDKVYRFKSIICVCSNGSMMSLTRNVDDFYETEFNKARDNLTKNWNAYLVDSYIYTKQELNKWVSIQYQNNSIISEKDILNQKILIEKRYADENLNKYLNQNIVEFNKIGFELNFGEII